MIKLEQIYILTGAMFAAFAALAFFNRTNSRRFGNGGFWAVLAISFLLGSHIGDFANGLLVLILALVAGLGGMGSPRHSQSSSSAREPGNALIIIALIIPAITLVGSIVLKTGKIGGVSIVIPQQVTPICLAAGVLAALLAAMIWLRPRLATPIREGYRLMELIGWTAILPQMLAALGTVFALAGVGKAVGTLATHWLPMNGPFAAVIVYCLGMAVFSVVMGNAFAAFPVMTAAIGLPLIVHQFGGNAVIMSAIGMLCGYCGTMMTPMAANFNIVPAALLELPDRAGVIKVQIRTAILVLIGNIVLMYFAVFRF